MGALLKLILSGVMIFVPSGASDTSASGVSAKQRTQYRALANEIGLIYNAQYRYADLAEAKRKSNLGAAGQYEFLDCDGEKRGQMGMCIGLTPHETWYYNSYNITVTYAYEKIDGQMYVRVFKLARGKVPGLLTK